MRDWKTSVVGIAGGMLSVLVPLLETGSHLDSSDWIKAAAFAALGLLSKDSGIAKRRVKQ